MKSATVFSRCARKTGFAGTTTTRYRLLEGVLLVVNHQRASEHRGFYVNAGLYFPELLEHPLAPCDLETAFRYRSSIPTPHVDWRIEETPGLRRAFIQQDLDDLLEAGDRDALKGLLLGALADVAGFAAVHGNRESVRRLNRDGSFRALIRREV
ncbi:DUF4304 domain-containing protein [Stenotrophomonas maltophilia]|uniref:DUF4304 domain-containing protein n=1 Tax=Stenotrophomonas riyadhensis TaxID=2859893 RepID=A0ABT2XC37_9GAMM|nr:DUF4304 domain-containing protein [Stenotrophomonas sp. CFS3442]MBH1617012.1 DUF4304 domain-containing protein [Stenotrophomonas maltophilia]MCV0323345.1 DUF4304 domain-containing protein [Stenotrophomonas sp. CFS3442]HEL4244307.1 DUF4304 domain-containing protein [Stenotrophomonas maltophilia]